MIGFRRRRLPPEAQQALSLDDGEHVLAWAASDTGHLVATRSALHDVAAGDRLFWDEIDKAVWRDGRLTVTETGGRAQRSWRLTDPSRLPETVRERVTSSIVSSTQHRLPSGGGVRIVCRRRAGEGDVRWMVIFERPGDADDPAAQQAADRLLAQAQATLRG